MNRLLVEKITRALERLRDRVAGNEIRIEEIIGSLGAIREQVNTTPAEPQNGADGVGVAAITGQQVDGRFVITSTLSDGSSTEFSFDLPTVEALPGIPGEVGPVGPAGPVGPSGPSGSDGNDGADGVGVADALIQGGRLILGLTNNTVIDAGSIEPSKPKWEEHLPFYVGSGESVATRPNYITKLEFNTVIDGQVVNDGIIMEMN